MRELTLIETGYLAGLLLLSLVLPLLSSLRGRPGAVSWRAGLKTVWCGQLLGAGCALVVLVSGGLAPYAFGLGVASYLRCGIVLLRQLRAGAAA
jgi:hypothetical protein